MRVDVFYMPELSKEAPKEDIGILGSTEKLDTYRLQVRFTSFGVLGGTGVAGFDRNVLMLIRLDAVEFVSRQYSLSLTYVVVPDGPESVARLVADKQSYALLCYFYC